MRGTIDLLSYAVEAVEKMNLAADESLPYDLVDIVKTHSMIAAGSAVIPIPGVDTLAAAANIWTMYARINERLRLPFSENLVKSIATGVATNLGSYLVAGIVFGAVSKFFPGVGSVVGTVVTGAVVYALTMASGIVYFKALGQLSKWEEKFTGENLKKAVNEVLKDKDGWKKIIESLKNEYKSLKK